MYTVFQLFWWRNIDKYDLLPILPTNLIRRWFYHWFSFNLSYLITFSSGVLLPFFHLTIGLFQFARFHSLSFFLFFLFRTIFLFWSTGLFILFRSHSNFVVFHSISPRLICFFFDKIFISFVSNILCLLLVSALISAVYAIVHTHRHTVTLDVQLLCFGYSLVALLVSSLFPG